MSIIFCFVASNLLAIIAKDEDIEMKKYKLKLVNGTYKEVNIPDDVKPSKELFEKLIEEGKTKDYQYKDSFGGKFEKFADKFLDFQPATGMGLGDKKMDLLMEDTAGSVPIAGNVARGLRNILKTKEEKAEDQQIRDRNKGLFTIGEIAGFLTVAPFLWLILLQKLKKISQQIKNRR